MCAAPASASARKVAHAGALATERASHELIRSSAANEIVFAVVGHVGSGTSEIAVMLRELLRDDQLPGGAFDVTVLKAREEIIAWARERSEDVPRGEPNTLVYTKCLQDLGDKMRDQTGDHRFCRTPACSATARPPASSAWP